MDYDFDGWSIKEDKRAIKEKNREKVIGVVE
jgi:hypothetical protein